MNKTLNTLCAALLISSTSNAFAASSVDLTVRGLITPSSCEPSLPSGGNVDIGKISAKDLNTDRPTFLASHAMQITVTCDAATLLAIEAKDNRDGTDYDNNTMMFGLGLINGSEKLGGMELRLTNAIADGVASRTIASLDNGLTWFTERNLMRTNIVSVADATTDAPIAVQSLTSDLSIHPVIAPASGLTLNNEVAIDGSVTLTVKYL
ncbi:DUF1120 domain-containing protein [Pseudomonas kairouanensis]|uniref:DUF1120 domain-containing protein n=1 Tax=Pseudomonas kairouanensis TaxID=2293832 RepID=A0A4Z0B334_9PSED|nr:DUF1120 domain-containing protein [Pseudomonas kairouanensis]TFY92628.1 DUF1120 domain-containing protein [Pseudomonas kairouanensis]